MKCTGSMSVGQKHVDVCLHHAKNERSHLLGPGSEGEMVTAVATGAPRGSQGRAEGSVRNADSGRVSCLGGRSCKRTFCVTHLMEIESSLN